MTVVGQQNPLSYLREITQEEGSCQMRTDSHTNTLEDTLCADVTHNGTGCYS